jgi:hypothetical protein
MANLLTAQLKANEWDELEKRITAMEQRFLEDSNV